MICCGGLQSPTAVSRSERKSKKDDMGNHLKVPYTYQVSPMGKFTLLRYLSEF